MTINGKLTFSHSSESDSAVKINPKKDINFFETLCKYCADNNVSLNSVTDFEFNEAVETLESYSENSDYEFYFWIAS